MTLAKEKAPREGGITFTVEEFCRRQGISHSTFYKLQRSPQTRVLVMRAPGTTLVRVPRRPRRTGCSGWKTLPTPERVRLETARRNVQRANAGRRAALSKAQGAVISQQKYFRSEEDKAAAKNAMLASADAIFASQLKPPTKADKIASARAAARAVAQGQRCAKKVLRKIGRYKVHPVTSYLPLLEDEEFDKLVESVSVTVCRNQLFLAMMAKC